MTNPNWRIEERKKKEKIHAHCLECTARLKDANLADMKMCINPQCEMYEIIVSNWYVWGEDE